MNDERWVVDTTRPIDIIHDNNFSIVFNTLAPISNIYGGFFREMTMELVHEIERLQTENIKLDNFGEKMSTYAGQWMGFYYDEKIWNDAVRVGCRLLVSENIKLRNTISDLAERLAKLGPDNPHEDNNDFNDSN